jgi:CRP/FNR family cyclic AMP-dependent transcriptional regulator
VNLNWIPPVKAFDPFPFGILVLLVSSESVFLTIFVIISQNRVASKLEEKLPEH